MKTVDPEAIDRLLREELAKPESLRRLGEFMSMEISERMGRVPNGTAQRLLGTDWEEIEEARGIANSALAEQQDKS